MTHWVLHVDLDQFVAAVELLRRPELRGRPVVVGGDGDPTKRGVVSTASYEAREYGVHSGMPLRTAARRCPDAVFLAVDRERYEAASATGFGKPAGVFRLTHESWYPLLGGRPTDVLWGIGAKTAERLAGLGITTVLDLARADPRALAAELGPTTGPWLVLLAQGRGRSTVASAPYVPRSRNRETTFQHDLEDWDRVLDEVAVLGRRVADDVGQEHRRAARVVVKVRYAPFETRTHGRALAAPTTDPAEIERAAVAALGAFTERRPVRLLGVRAELEA